MLKLETRSQARVAAEASTSAPLLSIVVPTFGERDNVEELVRRIGVALPHTAWEIVFVDDDNVLAPDYLQQALTFFSAHPAGTLNVRLYFPCTFGHPWGYRSVPYV